MLSRRSQGLAGGIPQQMEQMEKNGLARLVSYVAFGSRTGKQFDSGGKCLKFRDLNAEVDPKGRRDV